MAGTKQVETPEQRLEKVNAMIISDLQKRGYSPEVAKEIVRIARSTFTYNGSKPKPIAMQTVDPREDARYDKVKDKEKVKLFELHKNISENDITVAANIMKAVVQRPNEDVNRVYAMSSTWFKGPQTQIALTQKKLEAPTASYVYTVTINGAEYKVQSSKYLTATGGTNNLEGSMRGRLYSLLNDDPKSIMAITGPDSKVVDVNKFTNDNYNPAYNAIRSARANTAIDNGQALERAQDNLSVSRGQRRS